MPFFGSSRPAVDPNYKLQTESIYYSATQRIALVSLSTLLSFPLKTYISFLPLLLLSHFVCEINVIMLRRWRPQNLQQIEAVEQADKVKELRTALGPLSGHGLKFCSDACLRRYLEARNWNVDKAKKMLEETLKWRSTYKPQDIRWHEVAHEGETGKVSRADFHDRSGRTVLIMRPGMQEVEVTWKCYSVGLQRTKRGHICNFQQRFLFMSNENLDFWLQNTTSSDGNVRHLVYLLENAILNLPEGQEQMSWLVDFNGWSLNTNISIKTTRDIIHVLQNHYPERLAIVVLYNPPKFFEAFWKVVKFFVDPKTFEKIRFVYPNNKQSAEVMKSFFDAENLPSEFGGKASLKYDHEEFSRLMAEEDVKTAKYWGSDNMPCNDMNEKSGSELTPVV
ncbi:uncharacterized protein LOC108220696 isoform X1 [Daucus carota subsp. sativus]|uniref:uncharacterized protein LOC108220696 isoform X1 n=1 Tax=Daucus carota subsp. sativus TaxID=79200 RepID=UPI0007EF539D|nr:PREDICTED: random slug protein 5-like isoform X1 [Daucus carota subsp. sativus]